MTRVTGLFAIYFTWYDEAIFSILNDRLNVYFNECEVLCHPLSKNLKENYDSMLFEVLNGQGMFRTASMREIISLLLPWMVPMKFLFTFQLGFLCPKSTIVNNLHQQYHSLLESVPPFHLSYLMESFRKFLLGHCHSHLQRMMDLVCINHH